MTSDAVSLSMTVDRCGVLVVTGELDLPTAPMLEEEVSRLDGPLLLDLRPVSFMDSSGIAAMVRIRQRCRDAGEGFRVVDMSWAVRRVLELTGLLETFTEESQPTHV